MKSSNLFNLLEIQGLVPLETAIEELSESERSTIDDFERTQSRGRRMTADRGKLIYRSGATSVSLVSYDIVSYDINGSDEVWGRVYGGVYVFMLQDSRMFESLKLVNRSSGGFKSMSDLAHDFMRAVDVVFGKVTEEMYVNYYLIHSLTNEESFREFLVKIATEKLRWGTLDLAFEVARGRGWDVRSLQEMYKRVQRNIMAGRALSE